MQFEMKMPDLSTNESDVRIVRWLVEPGQAVERGRPLLEVETDKATMEVESPVSGVLQEVRSHVDEAVGVGHIIAVLEVAGATPAAAAAAPTAEAKAASPPAVARTAAAGGGGMFARNRAAAAAPAKAAAAGIALTLPQRVAAKRLQESKQTIPHFYLQTSVNAAGMIARREAAAPKKLAWDALFVLAVAKAIAKFERFRCRLDGERLVPVESDAIGVAVDVNDELYVIPIHSPATKTVELISQEIRESVQRIREGDVEARRIRPALITVTNLGVCNVEGIIPIINPPEPAILGIGKVAPTPVARDDGSVGVEHRCALTLCVDHRVCSGRYAGEFLGAIVKELETF